jgi:hypothetical protein
MLRFDRFEVNELFLSPSSSAIHLVANAEDKAVEVYSAAFFYAVFTRFQEKKFGVKLQNLV